MAIFLVINADDFGFTEGVTRGIVECAEAKGITSASAMLCHPEFVARLEKYLPALKVPCGVHLQTTNGRPLSAQMRQYCQSSGGVFPNSPLEVGFPAELVGIEWAAQLAFFRRKFGEPSHLDTHHGVQNREEYSEVFLQLARREGLPARGNDPAFYSRAAAVDTPVTYAVTGHNGEWTGTGGDVHMALSSVEKLMRQTPPGMAIELIVHPGHDDADLRAVSTFTTCRASELKILSGAGFARAIAKLGIKPISFAELKTSKKTGRRKNS